MRRALALCFLVAATCFVPVASAQNRDPAAAEALFRQGRELMQAGKYDEACAKFKASQDLDPGVGTLLNLGECHEKAGHTASAWAIFQEARDSAHRAGDRAREKLAQKHADELAAKLPTLTIEVAPAAKVDGLVVRRDDVTVSAASLGVAIPVDPGQITIAASAPGYADWKKTVDVAGAGSKVKVTIDALEKLPEAPAAPEETAPEPELTAAPPPPPKPSSTQKTIGFVAMGVGAVGLGVGSFFGLRARSKWNDAKGHCANGTSGCDSTGLDLGDQAGSAADISTIAFVAGGVALAGGVVLWLTAPSSHQEQTARLGIGLSGSQSVGLSVHGQY